MRGRVTSSSPSAWHAASLSAAAPILTGVLCCAASSRACPRCPVRRASFPRPVSWWLLSVSALPVCGLFLQVLFASCCWLLQPPLVIRSCPCARYSRYRRRAHALVLPCLPFRLCNHSPLLSVHFAAACCFLPALPLFPSSHLYSSPRTFPPCAVPLRSPTCPPPLFSTPHSTAAVSIFGSGVCSGLLG